MLLPWYRGWRDKAARFFARFVLSFFSQRRSDIAAKNGEKREIWKYEEEEEEEEEEQDAINSLKEEEEEEGLVSALRSSAKRSRYSRKFISIMKAPNKCPPEGDVSSSYQFSRPPLPLQPIPFFAANLGEYYWSIKWKGPSACFSIFSFLFRLLTSFFFTPKRWDCKKCRKISAGQQQQLGGERGRKHNSAKMFNRRGWKKVWRKEEGDTAGIPLSFLLGPSPEREEGRGCLGSFSSPTKPSAKWRHNRQRDVLPKHRGKTVDTFFFLFFSLLPPLWLWLSTVQYTSSPPSQPLSAVDVIYRQMCTTSVHYKRSPTPQ